MADSRRLFLGVDGGQSSTRAVVGTATGRILGRASSGPCNHVTPGSGAAKLRRTVTALLKDLHVAAGLPPDAAFEAACYGMSGGPEDKRRILRELTPAEVVEVTSDAEAALVGATAGGAGVAVVAGTGSIALARNAEGHRARSGGWGYIFGDEGGAFDIARRALRRALAAEEGWGPPTALLELFRRQVSVGTANEALHQFYTAAWPRDRIARLAPRVDGEAERGDRQAWEVLREAGVALAELAAHAARSVPGGGCGLVVYPCGGVFCSRRVASAFSAAIRERGFEIGAPAHNPIIGALLLAYRARGVQVRIREEA